MEAEGGEENGWLLRMKRGDVLDKATVRTRGMESQSDREAECTGGHSRDCRVG